MARQQRKQSSTDIYHVMIHGINDEYVFNDEVDKRVFLNQLVKRQEDIPFELYGYCMMDNHAHLILEIEFELLSKLVQSINVSYAIYYNEKHKKSGHVFHDRFRSEPIQSDEYLLTCLRYIHNNPVKANIIQGPFDYSWSSAAEYLEKNYSYISPKGAELVEATFKTPHHLVEFHQKEETWEFIDVKSTQFTIKQQILDLFEAQYLKKTAAESLALMDKADKIQFAKELSQRTSATMDEIAEMLNASRTSVYRYLKEV